ncbi:MAG: PD-(D/E)XK nuclease family transposase, partial [Clostridia bacterium]|nr:PD-(D/E)XK nuclease family transposase [Clostridia bacterium]
KIKDYHTVIDLAIKAHTEIEFNNVIQLHIIELEKYQEQKKSAGKIELWLEFIINPEGEEMIKMARTQAELEEAVRQLRLLNADDEVREIAEAQEWAEYMRWYELHEEREEARTTGRKEEKKAIAKKMLEQKADIKFIMTCTGLTKKEIEELNLAV